MKQVPRLVMLTAVVLCVLAGTLGTALFLESVLSHATLAGTAISRAKWERTVEALGARSVDVLAETADVDLVLLLAVCAAASGIAWTAEALWIRSRRRSSLEHALAVSGRGWLWWLLPGVWEALWWMTHQGPGFEGLAAFLQTTPQFWFAAALAGWLSSVFRSHGAGGGGQESEVSKRKPLSTVNCQLSTDDGRRTTDQSADRQSSIANLPPRSLWLAIAAYVVVFTAMNWQLYRGLWVPHGDSAMYEEHLWNLEHGKGFRSYLDDGRLFLGEHIQVIHLLLVPLHLLWPSLMLLDLVETLALAAGALPVFWMTARHTGSRRAGVLLAAAYLMYFPLQFLDIAIDLKTFRPIALGVPAMLFAFDQLERGRFKTAVLLLVLALSAKEDYALVIAPLGVWIAARAGWGRVFNSSILRTTCDVHGKRRGKIKELKTRPRPRWVIRGTLLAGLSALYLVLATRVVIPAFRGGEEVHYARYFSRFGKTLGEIAGSMLARPDLLLGELATVNTAVYLLAVLAPLGFLPLFSPGRLAVGLPLLLLLCLNEIARDPWHHFHAPLVPVVFWAAAAAPAGLSWLARRFQRWRGDAAGSVPDAVQKPGVSENAGLLAATRFACASALATGLFFSLSPLGIAFWDAGSRVYWKNLYVPGPRAGMFAHVESLIPHDARVFSTDFVHPRFTHYKRSYDFSDRPRRSDAELCRPVPGETYYIVIDIDHPYRRGHRLEDKDDFRQCRDEWERIEHPAEEYFLVLKRRTTRPAAPDND